MNELLYMNATCSPCSQHFVFQSLGDTTPRKVRDESIRSHKESLHQKQGEAERKLQQHHHDFLQLEIRKFRRRKLLQFHQLENNLLREVSKMYSKQQEARTT